MPRILLVLLLATAPLWAQGTATIFGTVTDSTGSVAPNVTVKSVQVATGMARQTVSDQRGDYVITQLPIGAYTLSAEVTASGRDLGPRLCNNDSSIVIGNRYDRQKAISRQCRTLRKGLPKPNCKAFPRLPRLACQPLVKH